MASNYTTNYNLCQWEPTDQVQRTDFNADNAKLDAALAAKAEAAALTAAVGRVTALENTRATQTALNQVNATLTARANALDEARCLDRLIDYTMPSDAAALDLDLSQIQATDYACLTLVLQVKADGTLVMRFNGLDSESYVSLSTDTTASPVSNYLGLMSEASYGGTMFCSIWPEGFSRNSTVWSLVGANPRVGYGFNVSGGRCSSFSYTQLTTLNLLLRNNEAGTNLIKAGSRFRLYGLR